MRRFLAFALLLGITSCGGDIGPDGYLVGGECTSDRDCQEVCLRKGDFPGGMCSIKCKSDQDCPSDTVCIDKDGGYCAYQCEEHVDCRVDYRCERKKRKSGGEELVCIGDD